MRNEKYYYKILLQPIIQGSVGSRRISWLKNLRVWFNTSTIGTTNEDEEQTSLLGLKAAKVTSYKPLNDKHTGC